MPRGSAAASAICAPTVMHRIERGHRLLEDHGDPLAAHPRIAASASPAGRVSLPVGSMALPPMRMLAARRAVRMMRQRRDALAGTAFTDDAPGSRLGQRRRRHRRPPAPAALATEVDARSRTLEHVLVIASRSIRGSSASRRPSPTKLKLVRQRDHERQGTLRARALARYSLCVVQHVAPARRRRLDAVAEKADVGFQQDGARHVQRGGDHDRRDGVGQQLAEHDVRSRCAQRHLPRRRNRARAASGSAPRRCARPPSRRSAR